MDVGIRSTPAAPTGPLKIGEGVSAPIVTDAPKPASSGTAPLAKDSSSAATNSALDVSPKVKIDDIKIDPPSNTALVIGPSILEKSGKGPGDPPSQPWLKPTTTSAPSNNAPAPKAGDDDAISPWTDYKHKEKGSSEPVILKPTTHSAPTAPQYPPITNTAPVQPQPPGTNAKPTEPIPPKPANNGEPSKIPPKPEVTSQKPSPATPEPVKPKPPSGEVTPSPPKVNTPDTGKATGRGFATQGDPIIKTGDGLQFSINKPGKYTSLKSDSGDFLMQQEVAKTKDNRHYNTAYGFQLGSNKITFDTAGGTKTATMKVNGQEVKLGFSPVNMTLPDGGTLKYDPKTNKIQIHSAAGDDVTIQRTVNPAGTNYLNAKIDMAASRPAGSVKGVLGSLDADSDAKNDALMRDGKAFSGAIGDLWKTPEKFIDEWRSKPDENLL